MTEAATPLLDRLADRVSAMPPPEIRAFVRGLPDSLRGSLAWCIREREKQRALHDLGHFVRRYLAEYLTEAPADQHAQLMAELTLLGQRLLTTDDGERAAGYGVALPRGWGKSTICSLFYPLWLLCRGEPFILLVSDTSAQACERADEIRAELESNELLRRDFGALAPHARKRGADEPAGQEKWTQRDFICSNGTRVSARGTGSRVRGLKQRANRPTALIVDDLENDEAVETVGRRRKTLRWLKKALLPCLDPRRGVVLVNGTILHRDSALATVLRTAAECAPGEPVPFRRYVKRRWKAVVEDEHGNRRSTWPARFTLEFLYYLRDEELGSIVFSQEYQNEPVDDETTRFKLDWLTAAKSRGAAYSFIRAPVPTSECWVVVQAWDLALEFDERAARKKDSDYSVGVTLGLDANDHVRLLRGVRRRGLTPVQLWSLIAAEFEIVRPRMVVMQNTPFEKIHQWVLGGASGIPIVGQSAAKGKHDLAEGIPALSVLFESGKVVLPYGDDADARGFVDVLCDELHGYLVEAHDDTPDAFNIGWTRLREFVGTRRADPELAAVNARARMGRRVQALGSF